MRSDMFIVLWPEYETVYTSRRRNIIHENCAKVDIITLLLPYWLSGRTRDRQLTSFGYPFLVQKHQQCFTFHPSLSLSNLPFSCCAMRFSIIHLRVFAGWLRSVFQLAGFVSFSGAFNPDLVELFSSALVLINLLAFCLFCLELCFKEKVTLFL